MPQHNLYSVKNCHKQFGQGFRPPLLGNAQIYMRFFLAWGSPLPLSVTFSFSLSPDQIKSYKTKSSIIFSFYFTLCIREGFRKKTLIFLWSFAKPPSDPPRYGLFTDKKITPIFSFGNKISNGWNKFYIWSHSKILFFCSLILTFFFPGFGPLRLLSKLS